jgi:pimeloyl-ACP methyl ester carboxylesterase
MPPGRGYDYDTLAEDMACVIDRLDLRDLTLVGQSMGAGEIVRYISRHGEGQCWGDQYDASHALGTMLKTRDNPEAQDRSLSEQTFTSWYSDYPNWLASGVSSFFMPGASNAQMEWIVRLCMQAPLKAVVGCYHSVVETDFRREVTAITLPTMIIQGDKDDATPIDFTGRVTAQMIKGSQFKVYRGEHHGLMVTHAEQFNNDLAQFAAT